MFTVALSCLLLHCHVYYLHTILNFIKLFLNEFALNFASLIVFLFSSTKCIDNKMEWNKLILC